VIIQNSRFWDSLR